MKTEFDQQPEHQQKESITGTEVTVAEVKKPQKPKKPPTAYQLYVDDLRSICLRQSHGKFANMWKNADVETKEKYLVRKSLQT